MFGSLLTKCIRDQYTEDGGLLKEGVLVMALGAGSSVLTVYALSLLGVFV